MLLTVLMIARTCIQITGLGRLQFGNFCQCVRVSETTNTVNKAKVETATRERMIFEAREEQALKKVMTTENLTKLIAVINAISWRKINFTAVS